MSGFVALIPVLPGHEEELRCAVAGFGNGATSPFRHVPGTHFARFAVLPTRIPYEGTTVELRSTWLLFAVDFDGQFDESEFRARRINRAAFDRYAKSLYDSEPLHEVWRHCHDYQNARDRFSCWLWTGVCKRFVMYRDYPDRTLSEVCRALEISCEYREVLATARDEALRDFLQAL
jgi:hypothetical protein